MADKGGGGGGEEQDDSQKTEDPTRKRLEEARKQGQVPLSREANTWLMLFTGALIVMMLLPSLMDDLTKYMAAILAASATTPLSLPQEAGKVLADVTAKSLAVLGLPFVIFIMAAILGTVVQIGFLMSSESIKPSMDKIDIMKGVQRMFSMRALMELFKGILKLVIIGTVSAMVLLPLLPTIDNHVGQPIPLALNDLHDIMGRLLTAILAALFLLALVDLIYVRLDFNKRMKMTRQEIRDEYKQTEGDPHVKARLRQLRTEKARQRMIQSVPSADVVITNPTHYAVALKYDPATMDAPIVVAKGVDAFAARIREMAEKHNVAIVENPPLARSLFASVDVDEMISPDLYKAVAEIISYVFRLKGRAVHR